MNQPIFNEVRSGVRNMGAAFWGVLLAMVCLLGMAMPSQAQVRITTAAAGNRVVEGSSGGTTNLNLRITILAAPNQTYRVSYQAQAGPVDPSDTTKPVAKTGGNLSEDDFDGDVRTINIGTNNAGFGSSNTVPVSVNADSYDEGDSAVGSAEFDHEYFNVVLRGVENTNANGPSTSIDTTNNNDRQECIIVDDDAPPVLSVMQIPDQSNRVYFGDSFFPEGNPGDTNVLRVRVLANRASGKLVQFRYRSYSGTASSSDFTAADEIITIAPNTNTEYQGVENPPPAVIITVPIVGDTLDEADETVVVDIRDPGNTVYGTVSNVSTSNFATTATIYDDDAPSVTISDASVIEGDDPTGAVVKATFQVKLSTTSPQVVRVFYSTSSNTAVTTVVNGLPADYVPVSGQSLVFAPGETTKFVTADILGDKIAEGASLTDRTENFFMNLSADNAAFNPTLGVTFTNTGNGPGRARCVINDDDALPQIQFGPPNDTNAGNLLINEPDLDINGIPTQATANFQVSLTDRSGIPVSFTYSTSDGTAIDGANDPVSSTNPKDYRSTSTTLTINPGETQLPLTYFENDDLGVPQFKTGIPVYGDNVDETDETFFVTLSNVQGATVLDGQAQANIIDNDGPFVEINGGIVGGVKQDGVARTEGDTGPNPFDFTVTLSAPSVQTVTVTLSTADFSATAGTDYNGFTGRILTFAPGETSKIVTVPVIGDIADERNETFAVNIVSVSGGQDPATGNGNPQAVGTILDDDPTPSIAIDGKIEPDGTNLVSIQEGNAGQTNMTFTVRLSAPTFQNVSFNYATADDTATLADNDYLQQTGQVVIPAGTVSTTINIRVIGDVKKEANEDVKVNITNVVNADAASPVSDLQGVGTILNDDQAPAGVTITPTTLTTSESGSPKTFTVVLDRLPTADVTVRFTSSDTSEGLVSTGGATPAASVNLTFTPANYNVAQTVTVTGQDDSLVDGDITYLINSENVQSSDALYAGLNPIDVAVTNVDDEVPGFRISKTTLQTTEAGITDTFTVRLNVAPTSDVTINVSSTNTAEGTVSPATLTFTPGNFATPQSVVVTGQDDVVRDGDQAYQVILSPATSADARYSGLDPADLDATNIDNETPGIIVVPTQGLTTTEAGGTATFTVQLSSPPTSQVVIALRSSDTTEGTVSPTSLTFTSANFNQPQTVTVTGRDDSLDDDDIAYTIITDPAQTSDVDYNAMDATDVAVTNIDDEVPGIVVAPASLNVSENVGTTTFTVRLTTQPASDVTVPVVSAQPAVADVTPNTLTFTPANFNTVQTVTVTVTDDQVDNDNRTFNITLGQTTSVDANYSGLTQTLPITVVDNDTAGITVTPRSGLRVTEAAGTGNTATFTVKLNSQPTSTVTIGLYSSDQSEATVSPTSLDFDQNNWNTPQTVTVTGVDDSVDDGNVNFTIVTTPAVSADARYNTLDASNVTGSNTDDDVTGIIVTPVNLTVSEKATRTQFTVVLRSQPTGLVTIPIVSNDTSEGIVTTSSLRFTIANWNVPQRVVVVGVNDFEDDGDVLFKVITQPAVSADLTYNNLDAVDVNVTNNDDDTAGISITPTTKLTTRESGTTATFSVKLLSQPTANVTIGLSSSDTTEGTVSPSSLTFTNANWNTAQNVTVRGVNDSLEDGHVDYTIVTEPATSSDAGYSGRNAADVAAVNLDDDDRTPPTVTIASPLNGASYRQMSKVTGTAKDAKDPALFYVSGVQSVGVLLVRYDNPGTPQNEFGYYNPSTGQYEPNSNINTQVIPATSFNERSGAYTVDLPTEGTSSLAPGRYFARTYAKDRAGNATLHSGVSFFVDPTAPPAPVITTPANGATVNAAPRIQGTAADNAGGSGISRVDLIVYRRVNSTNGLPAGYLAADGSFTPTYSGAVNRLTATGTTNWTLNLPSLPAATYDVKAFAVDLTGNQSGPGVSSFTLAGSEEFAGNTTYLISVPYMDDASINGTTTPLKAFTVPPIDPATGARNFLLRRWNPQTLQFEDLQNGAILRRGEGYLLTPVNRGTSIRRPAQDSTRKPLLSTIQEFQITLRNNPSVASDADNNGYNLIGDPFDPALFSSADWLNARVSANLGGQTFTGTVAEAARQNPPILDSRLFTYDPQTNTYTPVSGNLLPFRGYYVRTFVDGVQVNLKAVK
jgi:hypothetical protein